MTFSLLLSLQDVLQPFLDFPFFPFPVSPQTSQEKNEGA